MASINELVGAAKQSSDLEARPMKIRYQESTTIQSGAYFRQTFPKVADDFLDCRNIRMRFNLNIVSTDPDTVVDSTDVRCIINRLRVLSGSQVLADVSEASELFQLETLTETSTSDSEYGRYLTGNAPLATRQVYPTTREYICSVCPKGSVLNGEHLIPLSRCNDLHLEVWLERPERVLYSPLTDSSATYNLTDTELLCTYIRSRSISQYYNTNPLSFHVTDYSHRYSTVLSQQALIRWSSAHTSLNKVLTVLRPQTQVTGVDKLDRFSSFNSGQDIQQHNVFLNNILYFEEDVDSVEESWQHLVASWPSVKRAEYFNELFNTTRNVIAVNIQAAPPAFHKQITSGVKTSDLNSDIVLRVNFSGPPGSPLRSDSYLCSDALIYLDGNGRKDLMVKY